MHASRRSAPNLNHSFFAATAWSPPFVFSMLTVYYDADLVTHEYFLHTNIKKSNLCRCHCKFWAAVHSEHRLPYSILSDNDRMASGNAQQSAFRNFNGILDDRNGRWLKSAAIENGGSCWLWSFFVKTTTHSSWTSWQIRSSSVLWHNTIYENVLDVWTKKIGVLYVQ